MARINIEDSLFKDPRWWNLIIKLGCQYKGLGYLAKAWILAQEHWIEHRAIPSKAWPKELDILIEVELAERNEQGLIYVKGSKKAFGWLEQRVEAGRKGGIKKRTQNEANSNQENIQKHGARAILNKAVESGRLAKPTECQACGIGGVVIEGHHSDYSKPLDVDWLCKNCHTSVHKSLRFQAVANQSLESAKAPSLALSLTQDNNRNIINNISSSSLEPNDSEKRKLSKKQTFKISNSKELAELIPFESKQTFFELYPDQEFFKKEFLKINNWIHTNPKKCTRSVRGWVQFLSNWFESAWNKHQKNIIGNKAAGHKITVEEAMQWISEGL